MTSKYALNPNLHVCVTPAGAYHAATAAAGDPTAVLLARLLGLPATPLLDGAALRDLAMAQDEDAMLEMLYRMQEVGWLDGAAAARPAPNLNMERDVPRLLAELTRDGRALLADEQGFHLASTGFAHEAVEELAALASEVTALQRRYQSLVRDNLRIQAAGWGAVDAAANGQLSFWPLRVGAHSFVLTIAGAPVLDRPAFTDLIWWLFRRYA